jgi:uncharacterized membrane protein (UPF0127 family)
MNPLSGIFGGLRKHLISRRRETPPTRLLVSNLTRHTVLATRMEVADSGSRRSKGLLGRAQLSPGEGLWILPCEAVHTFFMQFPIDLVYLDRKNRIRKLSSAVPPWRLSACFSAHSVLELIPGTIRSTRTEVGDLVEFSAAPAASDSSESPSAHA